MIESHHYTLIKPSRFATGSNSSVYINLKGNWYDNYYVCMEFNKGIFLFLLTVSYFFTYGNCSGETCYSLSDGEMNHSGYCSTSCKHGTLVPSAKCRKFRQSPMCCLPRLKGKRVF